MSNNPKKPVISELNDDDAADLLLDTEFWSDDFEDESIDDEDALCPECDGQGITLYDDELDEETCHCCGGVGYFVRL